MISTIQRPKDENERLNHRPGHDWLTGLYDRGEAQKRIDSLIVERGCGVMILLDVDHFRRINSRYGHIVGDHVLSSIAAVLDSMVFRHDVVGRVDDDEFVVFMPVKQDEKFLQQRCRQIRDRLKTMSLPGGAEISISLSTGGAVYDEGDTYRSMFDRAYGELDKDKAGSCAAATDVDGCKANFMVDLKQVRGELAEQSLIPGAYCQDYETFKHIYRFVERRLRRAEISSYILLITLTDGKGDFPPLSRREKQMAVLKDQVQLSLRSGDVFTQYSSCQYLVMISDASAENVEMIAGRICAAFYAAIGDDCRGVLLHSCYPMWPAGEKER